MKGDKILTENEKKFLNSIKTHKPQEFHLKSSSQFDRIYGNSANREEGVRDGTVLGGGESLSNEEIRRRRLEKFEKLTRPVAKSDASSDIRWEYLHYD